MEECVRTPCSRVTRTDSGLHAISYAFQVPTNKNFLLLGIRVRLRKIQFYWQWVRNGYGVPAPQTVKLSVLSRYGYLDGTWVESGTYLGQTTEFLARKASQVITIEPSHELVTRARKKLSKFGNTRVIEGLSEFELPKLLSGLSGDVSFWLDGHASGGITYGRPEDTPIREELKAIAKYLERWERAAILIDDFRGFGGRGADQGDYPSRSDLVSWADENELNWTVQHDIFIAYK